MLIDSAAFAVDTKPKTISEINNFLIIFSPFNTTPFPPN
jgi:hypothetical protein